MLLVAIQVALAAEGTALTVGLSSTSYSSDNRALAGTGGMLGIERVHDGHYVHGQLAHLVGLGSTWEVCGSAGFVRQTHWSPTAGAEACVLLGRQVSFPTTEHPLPLSGPAPSIGLRLEPLRFTYERATVSSLAIGVGTGWEPHSSLPLALRIGFFSLAISI
jgi:hypothetical protein